MPVEVHAEDQYAVVEANVTLSELQASLPPGLHYRAPELPLTVGEWLLCGGVGLLNAPAVRSDVLGLSYLRDGEPVQVGGRVVKNVAGYDLTRLVVGSDASLSGSLRIVSTNLRLRPRPRLATREMLLTDPDEAWAGLRSLGAAYALAARAGDSWRLQATWWGEAPEWGAPAAFPLPRPGEWRDARGPFPRPPRELDDLEQRVLAAL